MPESMLDELERLAPAVDMSASRELFERSRGPTRPRWVLPAAVVVLLVVGLVGVWALSQRGSELRPGDDGARPGGEPTFELLAVDTTGWAAGTVLTADDQASYDEQWDTLRPAGDQPAVDFDRSVVAVFTIPGGGCPAQLERFVVDGSVWTPVFVQSGDACGDIGLHWAHVVAFDRGAVDAETTFRNPFQIEGFQELGLSPPATGDEFEVFAVGESSLEFGSMHAADGSAEFAALWSELDPGFEAPAIDFARWVALVVTMPDNACPDTLVRFEVQADFWWMPVFEEETTDCEDPLLAWTYVVGIERSALGPAVGFDLASDQLFGAVDPSFELEVTPATPSPPATTSPPTTVDRPAVEATPPWREVAFVGSDDGQPLPAWAVDDEQYAEVVSRLQITDPPEIDFDNEIVVIFPITHNSCTPSLVTINRDTDVWHARFGRDLGPGGCDDIGLASASVVAIERNALTDELTIATQREAWGPPFGTTTIRLADGQAIDGTVELASPIHTGCGGESAPAVFVDVISTFDRDLVVTWLVDGTPAGSTSTQVGASREIGTWIEIDPSVLDGTRGEVVVSDVDSPAGEWRFTFEITEGDRAAAATACNP